MQEFQLAKTQKNYISSLQKERVYAESMQYNFKAWFCKNNSSSLNSPVKLGHLIEYKIIFITRFVGFGPS